MNNCLRGVCIVFDNGGGLILWYFYLFVDFYRICILLKIRLMLYLENYIVIFLLKLFVSI